MRVAVHENGWLDLREHCADLPFDIRVSADIEDLAEIARRSDALVMSSFAYDATLARALARPGSQLRFIQFLSSGYERAQNFGLPDGLVLSNASEIWAPPVAEHAVGLLLGLMRQLHELERFRAKRIWGGEQLLSALGSLDGARIAIVGYGTIGREIAKRLKPFGSTVIGVARSPKSCSEADQVVALADLAELLPTLNALINVVPATPETVKLVDAAMISRLQSSAVIINVGRGSTIDEAALFMALQEKRIAGAGLDVFEAEPLPATSPLWSLDNVILSPHCAANGSKLAIQRMHELCRQNLVSIWRGEDLRSQVHAFTSARP